jgi:hypothetical protein
LAPDSDHLEPDFLKAVAVEVKRFREKKTMKIHNEKGERTMTKETKQRLETEPLPSDSDGLGAIVVGNAVIGDVPEVNGEGALEENKFVPTRHELSILARYWLKEVLTIRFDCFVYAYSGSREIRVPPYAYRRLGRIERILGADAIETLGREVMSELEPKVDPRLWKMFLEGEEPRRDERGLPVITPPEWR